jgi:hypothetical protein
LIFGPSFDLPSPAQRINDTLARISNGGAENLNLLGDGVEGSGRCRGSGRFFISKGFQLGWVVTMEATPANLSPIPHSSPKRPSKSPKPAFPTLEDRFGLFCMKQDAKPMKQVASDHRKLCSERSTWMPQALNFLDADREFSCC